MKKIVFGILLLITQWNATAQSSIYADALYLKTHQDPYMGTIILTDNIKDVLQKYYPPGTAITAALLDNNNFHKTLFVDNGANAAAEEFMKSATTSGVASLDPTTKIIDGLAKFLVKRTKQELSISFFEKFKEKLDEPKNIDLRTLFPKTYSALKAIDLEIYNFNAYLQTLRETFDDDLATLSVHLSTLLDNHAAYFTAHPELRATLTSGIYISQSIHDGLHPGELIENFPANAWEDHAILNKNYAAVFKTIQLLSSSFKDPNSNGNYWMPATEIKKILNDDILLKLYLGLLVEKAKENGGIPYTTSSASLDLASILNGHASQLSNYRNLLSGLLTRTRTIEAKIIDFKSNVKDSLQFEQYYGLEASGIDMMKFVVVNQELLGLPKTAVDLGATTKSYFDTTQSIADMAIDVNRRKYSAAIVSLATIVESSLEGETTNKPDRNALFKYGSFMAAVTQAKTSDEVEQAIESFALPTGSARIKRESRMNVSFNAYCGLFYGGERIQGLDNRYKDIFGITAPIGISISAGKQHLFPFSSMSKFNGHWSSTFFFSVVDIGAVTAFRFVDDTTESTPKIELKNIISPGVFYSVGIPKCPLSINIGYQLGPLLRNVKATDNTVYQNSYSKISIALVVDIPILNLYSSSDNK